MAYQSIDISGIRKNFGSDDVLKGISLSIRAGEFISLVGMSGCGKSTLLRIIAGLEKPDQGTVSIGGEDVTGHDPSDRNLAMVFQSYALYPHMSVRQNIATPLRMRRLSLAARLPLIGRIAASREILNQIDADVEQSAAALHIHHLLNRKPARLSGGQRQRVALARALVRSPAAFLMDEPLSNLDAKLRVHMRAELTGLHRQLGATFVYVTHDQIEAMTMSDRIALMSEGRIEQLGTPSELYNSPATLTVARFIGTPAINLLPAEIDAGGAVTILGRQTGAVASLRNGGPVVSGMTLGVRPEDLHPRPDGFAARVVRSEMHGADSFVTCHLAGDETVTVCLRRQTGEPPGADAHGMIRLGFDPDRAHLFDAGGMRIKIMTHARAAA